MITALLWFHQASPQDSFEMVAGILRLFGEVFRPKVCQRVQVYQFE